MNITLTVVVSAIVILITALVVITMFGGTVTTFSTISEATNNCRTTGKIACETTGQLPFTWNTKFKAGDSVTDCKTLAQCDSCAACGWTLETQQPAGGGQTGSGR